MGDTTESRLLDSAVVAPSAEKQIEFLINIQRLLKEGAFVATYKYALLTALADLCVEKGDVCAAGLEEMSMDRRKVRRLLLEADYALHPTDLRERNRKRQNSPTKYWITG